MDSWSVRAPRPPRLLPPVAVDSTGLAGPTRGQSAGPNWRRTSHGLYVRREVDRQIPEQRILEESCRLPTGGAITGWAALRMHGVGFLDGRAGDLSELPVPLVVPPGAPLRAAAGIEVHREKLEPADIVLRYGVATTQPERAAFDAARWESDLRARVAVLDLTLASRAVARPSFDSYLASRAGAPGVRLVREALALTDPRCMSPMETHLRLIWILDAGLPTPRSNWPVADAAGRFIGRPDLLCEDLAVIGEFDGALHRSRSTHRDDLRRDDAFRSVGLEPFRVVGADIADVPRVLDRIRAAITRANDSTTPRTWRLKSNPSPVS